MGCFLLCLLLITGGPRSDTLRLMFWNLENFFDWRADSTAAPGSSDLAFSSRGERHWTRKRFYTKCNAIAKGVLWVGSAYGGLPDIIGFCEVENAFVLRRLVQSTALRKLDYGIVHYESPDRRGIDVALLYRRGRLKLLSSRPCHLYGADSSVLATRDILLAHFLGPGGDVAVLVNHHPSKYGGAAASQRRRELAARRLRDVSDSLYRAGHRLIVAMGDFNDTPDNPAFGCLDGRFQNLGLPLHLRGEGSIKYDGKWELIDLFFLAGAQGTQQLVRIPFLMQRDGTHGGSKPWRTYSGPRYAGGVSDHCPIWLDLPL